MEERKNKNHDRRPRQPRRDARPDPETAEKIIQLLRNISQTGTSVVMSTHNLPMLEKYPGIVYRCAEGHLEEVTGDYNKIKMELD